jgi:cell division protein FtsN
MTYNPNDPYRAGMSDEEIRRQARLNSLDNEIQPDPDLAEGPASGAKIAMFAIAIAVVMGALFYGLNNTTVNQAGTSPTSQTAQTEPANPAAPPGMRDVTPGRNTQPGTTTGAAPSRPAPPAPGDNAPAKQ